MNVRNARSAVIEALPHMLSSMALLWGAVMREEFQKRASDTGQSSKHSSTSVYFKSTKVCVTYMQIFYVLTGTYFFLFINIYVLIIMDYFFCSWCVHI